MVTRLFSTKGGLELYTHKLVEVLLQGGYQVTVVCESSDSSLRHPRLKIQTFPKPAKGLSKAQKLEHYYRHTSAVVAELPQVDLVHSQHLPVKSADVVNFHNQSVEQLNRVGLPWERAVNQLKSFCVPAYRLRREFDRRLCRDASCLVFSSEIGRNDFLRTYASDIADTPSVVAYPGSAMALESQDNGKLQPGSFLFVGRGYRKKGLDVLFAACQKLAARKLPFKLQIAGLREKPIDRLRLRLFGISRYVTYLGWQDNMSQVYATCSAFVMPSRLEPFGMAALQAMQAGLIPIVSRVSGISELIEPGVNGLVLENHLNADELAQHMMNLLKADDAQTEMSRQAKQTAQIYSWEKTAESVMHAYRLALQSKADKQTLQGAQRGQ